MNDPGPPAARPILVTGCHRSGTTWVGEMLAASSRVAHVHEPLNPAYRLSWLGAPPERPYLHITVDDDLGLGPSFDRLFELRAPFGAWVRSTRSPRHVAADLRESWRAIRWRRERRRVLVKDPLAVMAADWLASRYGCEVVALVRHPAAFAGSLKRLGWEFDFRDFARQPTLMEGPLRRFADDVERAAAHPPDIIDQAVLVWRCVNHVVAGYAEARPEWSVERYEDLASDPVNGARRLYARLGLPWDGATAGRVARLSSGDNPAEVALGRTRDVQRDSASAMWTWTHRLDPDEIERVRRGTADVAARFYGAADWDPPRWAASASS